MSTSPIVDLDPSAVLPFWQSKPCAHWCDSIHSARDHVDDRGHTAAERTEILLSHERMSVADMGSPDEFVPPSMLIMVERQEGETTARVIVDKCDEACLNLSQSEARELIEALERALATAKIASN